MASRWLPCLAALVACNATPPDATTPPPRPHVVVVIADDLGYADLGFTGVTDISTPAIDALARRGVVCTDAHVCASVCAPSRAGLLTGRYPQRFGFECNLAGVGGLPDAVPTLADRLGAAGYETCLVGKWHLGAAPEQHPRARGFEHFTGLIGGSRSYFPVERPSAARRLERDGAPLPETGFSYLTDLFSDEAVARIAQRDRQRPLLLVLSYTAPHGPMHARKDLLDHYAARIEQKKRAKYAAMVHAMDEGVGRVVEALETEGILDETLLVFLSDNGGATNNASDNGPWRGMKGSKWEGGQRVPFVVHWPRALAPGRHDGMVSSLDIATTALAAAGVAPEPDLDGVDLVPFLRGERQGSPHERLFWRRDVAAAVRDGDWKLVRIREKDGSFRDPVLVDLARHQDETVDQAADEPDRVRHLNELLEAWEAGLSPPGWIEGARWQRNQRYKHRMDVVGREAERRFP